jgi:hypothetical protein
VKGALAVVAGLLALSPLAMGGSACVLTLPGGDDGGAESGTGTTQTQTVGDQCTTVWTQFCKDAIVLCNESLDLNNCVATGTLECCTGSACASKAQSSAADVTTCTTAIDQEGCYAIAMGATPAECAAFFPDQ